MKRNQKLSHFRYIRQIASKIFRENNTKALVISNGLKFPQDDRTDTNFIALLKMHF